jgi:hypothetical protein
MHCKVTEKMMKALSASLLFITCCVSGLNAAPRTLEGLMLRVDVNGKAAGVVRLDKLVCWGQRSVRLH